MTDRAEIASEALLEEARRTESPDGELCLKIARALFDDGDVDSAYLWLARVADSNGPFRTWVAAGAALERFETLAAPAARRSVRIALAGSYTTSQYGSQLRLAALRRGVHVALYETGFDNYAQEVLDVGSQLYKFEPDYVILAVHEGAVPFPTLSHDPSDALDAETIRWQSCWEAIEKHSSARVIQHNFALRPDTAWGHLGARVPGSRDAMLRSLNSRLGEAAADRVLVIDCERIAGNFGKSRWFDDRYWHLAKQAVALEAVPELSRHTAAVLAAAEGLSSKCVVLDLDDTMWGGVIAEDGLFGIHLGGTPDGEAYLAFQDYLLALRERGVLLAVVSKNNDADARAPFEGHPDMHLKLTDFASFIANWDDKATNIVATASALSIGLDALVFVDDNPAEREAVRLIVPDVSVLSLPRDPARRVRALSDSLLFETATVTDDDLRRADQYRVRARTAQLQAQALSLEDFYRSLEMEALIAPFDDLNLSRITQLINKTNQFNITSRRHGQNEVRRFMEDERCVTFYVRLRDKFVDHGVVAVLIAVRDEDTLRIDSWLMSCRVIGRTVENEMLVYLYEWARRGGVRKLEGTYIPTEKNAIVSDLFERLGFYRVETSETEPVWRLDIEGEGVVRSDFIGSWNE